MRRIVALALGIGLAATACGGDAGDSGEGTRTYKAVFSRAIQLFPGSSVRVLGVDVGVVQNVTNIPEGVEVSFVVDDPEIQLPEDVEAAIVPASLLGERYVQLFPAYEGGPTLPDGATIPSSRTAVPAEPDELLRSLQDYLGALDPEVISRFVRNAATVLEGTGGDLNDLLRHGARVLATLAEKRDDLAEIVVQFERLSTALSTRQVALGQLIRRYNTVAGTLTSNRAALEGTISGLNEMATELASLLIEHRDPLSSDIRTLTRTGRTLSRNVDDLTRTGHWAERLFRAASRAVDYDRNWLRLNNQGQELAALIVLRLRQRLTDFCADSGIGFCANARFWATNAPSLFCLEGRCPERERPSPEATQEELTDAIEKAPSLADRLLERARELVCSVAADPESCRARKIAIVRCLGAGDPRRCLERREVSRLCRGASDVRGCLERRRHQDLREIVRDLLERTVGNPEGLGGLP